MLGPSGCGKSTLLMMLAGLIPTTSGTDHDRCGAPVTGPRRETSLVFQTPALFPWRTRALQRPVSRSRSSKAIGSAYRDEAIKLLEITGLHEFKDRLPEQLSGGMAQRVSLCRALITNPELLLMDEPFSALDALTRDDMGLELQRIWEQFRKTVMFVTHSIREAVFLSDRVIVFSPRPAVIVRDVRIDLPRPRTLEVQETPEFNRYCAAAPRQPGPLTRCLDAKVRTAPFAAVMPPNFAARSFRSPCSWRLAAPGASAVAVCKVPPSCCPVPMAVLRTHHRRAARPAGGGGVDAFGNPPGDAIAVVAGFATGSHDRHEPADPDEWCFPTSSMTQVVPKVALAPILIAWFGIGMQSRIVLAFLIAYFPDGHQHADRHPGNRGCEPALRALAGRVRMADPGQGAAAGRDPGDCERSQDHRGRRGDRHRGR